jgi:uncharacterized protein YecE (DUF72 family)
MRTKFHVGCGGWNYKDWVGTVYAEKPDLARYCDLFPATEIDHAYYRTPTRKAMEGLAEATPEDFALSVKLNRGLLPLKPFHERPDWYRLYLERVAFLGPRLRFILVQLSHFHRADRHLGHMMEMLDGLEAEGFPLGKVALEFRHRGWAEEEEFVARCAESGVVWVWTDHPTHPPCPVVGDVGYLRLIGDKKSDWHQGKEFSRSMIDTRARTKEWVDRFSAADFAEAYVFTKNTYAGFAPDTVNEFLVGVGRDPVEF